MSCLRSTICWHEAHRWVEQGTRHFLVVGTQWTKRNNGWSFSKNSQPRLNTREPTFETNVSDDRIITKVEQSHVRHIHLCTATWPALPCSNRPCHADHIIFYFLISIKFVQWIWPPPPQRTCGIHFVSAISSRYKTHPRNPLSHVSSRRAKQSQQHSPTTTTTAAKRTCKSEEFWEEEKRMKGELELPPGFRFHPTDDELVNHYLCRKCAGQPIAAPIIKEIDLYKFDPWQLPGPFNFSWVSCSFNLYDSIHWWWDSAAEMGFYGEKEWYFFSPRDRKYPNGSRPNRAAGSGYWKATGADKPIGKPKALGIKKALVFYSGKAPKGEKTNWIMHEYRLANVDRSASKKNNNLRVCLHFILFFYFFLFWFALF